MTQYTYTGDGAGIPGLPRTITDDEAAQRGLTELLAAAIANGSYQPVSTETEAAEPSAPEPSRRRRRAAEPPAGE